MAYDNNRASGGSFLSDEELVVIKLGSAAAEDRPVTLSSQPTLTSKLSTHNSVDYLTQSPPKPQIQRFAMRRSKSKPPPIIIATQSSDSQHDEEQQLLQPQLQQTEPPEPLTLLSRTDLPRKMRSSRKLSAFNEQLLERKMSQQSSKKSSLMSITDENCQKAASCDAISCPPPCKPGANKKKTVHVRATILL